VLARSTGFRGQHLLCLISELGDELLWAAGPPLFGVLTTGLAPGEDLAHVAHISRNHR
jgi:hypothetical protein